MDPISYRNQLSDQIAALQSYVSFRIRFTVTEYINLMLRKITETEYRIFNEVEALERS